MTVEILDLLKTRSSAGWPACPSPVSSVSYTYCYINESLLDEQLIPVRCLLVVADFQLQLLDNLCQVITIFLVFQSLYMELLFVQQLVITFYLMTEIQVILEQLLVEPQDFLLQIGILGSQQG